MDIGVWQLGAALVKALTYTATLGAAGMALFYVYVPGRTPPALIGGLAVAGLLLTALKFPLLAGMLGGFGRMLDPAMLRMPAGSGEGVSALLRAGGLVLMCAGMPVYRGQRMVMAAGAVLAATSFAAVGHVHARHGIASSALLVLHLGGAAFWLGALWPLARVLDRDPSRGASAVATFSQLALVVVPLLLAAGLWMLALLLPTPAALVTSPYGHWMIVKLTLVGALLGLAALNRLRLTPRLGAPGGRRALVHAIRAEILLGCAVLAVTAALTTFTGPRD